jgi:hypothetical protein
MTRTRTTRAAAVLLAAALTTFAAGCDDPQGVPTDKPAATVAPLPGVPSTTTTTTTPAKPAVDYARLLIQDRDISATNDTYTAQSPIINPDGRPGAEVLLVNQDQTKAINILIVGLPHATDGPSALGEAVANLAKSVTGGAPQPSAVGTGGTVVTGTSPDGTKSVTVLLFTEGSTLARIEFDGVAGQPAAPAFVTDVGQKQDIALRVGQP